MLTDLAPSPHRCNILAYALLSEALGLTPSPPVCAPAPEALPVPLPVPLGVPPHPRPRSGRPGWTPETASAALQSFVADQGRVPTRAEWRHPTQHQLPDPGFVRKTWGHLHTWYERLGLTPNPPPGRNQYTQ